jgi:hypothetical protein
MTSYSATRRRLLTTGGTLLIATQLPGAARGALVDSGVRLQPLPTRIYKTRDPGSERTESWVLWLLVETSAKRDLRVRSAKIQLLSGKDVMRTTGYDAEGVKALTIVPPFKPRLPDGRAPVAPIYWPQAVRVRCTEAASAGVDSMRVELTMDESGNAVLAAIVLGVETYVQKTSLIYPFKGKGIITNAGVTNGGHRNRSGQFATDGVGLDARYGVYT